MSSQVRAGLIGCGALSLMGILPQITQPDARERLELLAVCDVVEERARRTAEAFDVPLYFSDPSELIAVRDLDLVIVATPIPFHYELAMRALQAGKHVYVQKTMATTHREASEMVRTARRLGLKLAAAPGQMLSPSIRKMRELVASGALGKVYWAWGSTGGWGHDYEPQRQGEDVLHSVDPTWYYKAGGGPLVDVTVYVLHSLTGILGPALRVAAMSGIAVPTRQWRDKTIQLEVDDNSLLMLDFGDSTFAVAGGHSCMTGRLVTWGSMGIYGSEGAIETLEIEPLSGHPSRLYITSSHGLAEIGGEREGEYLPDSWLPYVDARHAAIPEPHVYADIMHLVDCIMADKDPIPSGEHAAHVVEIIEKGYVAARTGRAQHLESTFNLP
ncbi:oxidoreductase domain protein [Thermobaculum terrenum ATCC BAA-798]|uniref:Oxidoreductase domain protein n=1 Tax=Thermobaculum terrenum (strain ATCC BAA-798 / CCMEE 7001 / YNP1) TaxID=525904 RepID=D1CH14_THET1|nr:Gfo/Idh/MocA family oxidoreductase [Thermobaculum terrenum]ACZ43035.1 oxidoreductase domain protein [Thermobaculum terrenum ATCC BAA-798]